MDVSLNPICEAEDTRPNSNPFTVWFASVTTSCPYNPVAMPFRYLRSRGRLTDAHVLDADELKLCCPETQSPLHRELNTHRSGDPVSTSTLNVCGGDLSVSDL